MIIIGLQLQFSVQHALLSSLELNEEKVGEDGTQMEMEKMTAPKSNASPTDTKDKNAPISIQVDCDGNHQQLRGYPPG